MRYYYDILIIMFIIICNIGFWNILISIDFIFKNEGMKSDNKKSN